MISLVFGLLLSLEPQYASASPPGPRILSTSGILKRAREIARKAQNNLIDPTWEFGPNAQTILEAYGSVMRRQCLPVEELGKVPLQKCKLPDDNWFKYRYVAAIYAMYYYELGRSSVGGDGNIDGAPGRSVLPDDSKSRAAVENELKEIMAQLIKNSNGSDGPEYRRLDADISDVSVTSAMLVALSRIVDFAGDECYKTLLGDYKDNVKAVCERSLRIYWKGSIDGKPITNGLDPEAGKVQVHEIALQPGEGDDLRWIPSPTPSDVDVAEGQILYKIDTKGKQQTPAKGNVSGAYCTAAAGLSVWLAFRVGCATDDNFAARLGNVGEQEVRAVAERMLARAIQMITRDGQGLRELNRDLPEMKAAREASLLSYQLATVAELLKQLGHSEIWHDWPWKSDMAQFWCGLCEANTNGKCLVSKADVPFILAALSDDRRHRFHRPVEPVAPK